MKQTEITKRLSGLGGSKWEIYLKAKAMVEAGHDIIELTIGEPDIPTPPELIDVAIDGMRQGRTTYSVGAGEMGLRLSLAERYSNLANRQINAENVLCFPGTQTALYAVMMGVAEAGCEVLVGDPMYATYEGVIRATGAEMVSVPLSRENDFCLTVDELSKKITPKTTAILLTTPHNPTGSVLSKSHIEDIGNFAIEHDLWIISDEVYSDLVFDDAEFASALSIPEISDRVIVVSSISKSHAAPGFRSGWCIAPESFNEALLPLSETMLFGNQPFIADMTEHAIRNGSSVASGMKHRYSNRSKRLELRLSEHTDLKVHGPKAGMFAMINVSSTGMNGYDYAKDLLHRGGVAVMPGISFGDEMQEWVRIALTVDDSAFDLACERIISHFKFLKQ